MLRLYPKVNMGDMLHIWLLNAHTPSVLMDSRVPSPFRLYVCNINPYDYKIIILSPLGSGFEAIISFSCLTASQINPFHAAYLMSQWLALQHIRQMNLVLVTAWYIVVPNWKHYKCPSTLNWAKENCIVYNNDHGPITVILNKRWTSPSKFMKEASHKNRTLETSLWFKFKSQKKLVYNDRGQNVSYFWY